MHQYQLKKTKEISKIICNQCGREISVINGRPEKEVLCVEHGAIFLKRTGRIIDLTYVRNAMTGY